MRHFPSVIGRLHATGDLVLFAALTVALGGRAVAQDRPAGSDAPQEKAASGRAPDPAGAPRASADQAQEPEPGEAEALSVKYRFQEKYSVLPEPAHPERVTEYQVGVRETFKKVIEKQQGAPERFETSRQTLYVERAASVSKTGDLVNAVRRYDKFNFKGPVSTPSPKSPFFEGLTVWIHTRPDRGPEVLSLTTDRPIREFEYDTMSQVVSFPPLTVLLPSTTPRRVGDTWAVGPRAALPLLGELPDATTALEGTLIEVHKSPSENKLVAVLGISGHLKLSGGRGIALNAVMQFTFDPPPDNVAPGSPEATKAPGPSADRDTPKARTRGKIVDARGWISQLRMGRAASDRLEEDDGRLRETTTYELILARRPLSATGTSQVAPVPLPDAEPRATQANSWLVYDDPMGRFHFRHPQELRPTPEQLDLNAVELVDQDQGGAVLLVQIPPKETSAERDRQSRDPEWHKKELYATWERQKRDVLPGSSGWLPEADWKPLNRRVYRIEAAHRSKDPEPGRPHRVYGDYYLVLFPPNQSIVVNAMTERDSHVNFRNEVELLIKTFGFGPSEGMGPAKPAVPDRPASRAP
jgi:hypothetical protein